MKIRLLGSIILGLALAAAVSAQDANPVPSDGQAPAQGRGSGGWRGQGWRAGGGMAGPGMGGRGVTGTVTAIAPGFYTIKTDTGETYKVNFSANTRILKQTVRNRGEGDAKGEGGDPGNRQRPAPESIKSSDIKVGDAVAALGEVDPAAKSVGAVVVMQIDPERAKMMREQEANYGKTWLMGKVTAIDGTKVTVLGALDNAAHSFQADENTAFRKHRVPVTLADIQVGDLVRVEGAVKDGTFIAAWVTVMRMPPEGTPSVPSNAPSTPAPEPNAPPAN